MKSILTTVAAAALSVLAFSAQAQEPLKIGVIMPYSGPYASYGAQTQIGIDTYLAVHGNTIGGRPVEFIRKDTTGPAPDVARRLTQELVVRDQVDAIIGYAFTPNALSSAPVITEGMKPTLILNAATSGIIANSPYFVRMSFTVPQLAHTMGTWAAGNGIERAYVAVVDFGPGHDAEKAFTEGFTAAGGEIAGSVHTPLSLPDFGPYLQRIRDERPDAIYLFLPAGDQAIAFIKTYDEMGLADDGIKLLTHDITETGDLAAVGSAAQGVITAQFIDEALTHPQNVAFQEAFRDVTGTQHPSFLSVVAYDALAMLDRAVEGQPGALDPDATMSKLRGTATVSPRGDIEITADGEIRQNVYIRHAVFADNAVTMEMIETLPMVGDPSIDQ